jgi:predicted secreted protein
LANRPAVVAVSGWRGADRHRQRPAEFASRPRSIYDNVTLGIAAMLHCSRGAVKAIGGARLEPEKPKETTNMHLRCLLALLLLSSIAVAHENGGDVLFNRVYLDAQAERQIPNDEMRVVLVTEHQGKSPSDLAQRVNRDMAWALEVAKPVKEVAAGSGSYRTFPLYEDNLIVGWRAMQELELTSTAMERLTELTGRLQERLQVRDMQFRPTRATRDKHQEELMEEALAAFKRRAEIVSRHMPTKDYRIVEMHVNAGGGPQPVMYERAMMKMDAGGRPAVEAGTSLLIVTVSGNVQFYQ